DRTASSEQDVPRRGVALDELEVGVDAAPELLAGVLARAGGFGEHPLELVSGAPHAGEVQAVLRVEVVVDDRPGHARAPRDVLDRGALVALPGKELLGDVEKLLLADGSRHSPVPVTGDGALGL